MHYPITLLAIILAASSTLAAPLNGTLRYLGKRDSVCSINFRNAVTKNSCLPKKVAFTLTGDSTINRVRLPDARMASVPKHAQCDHTIELQLLSHVAETSGLCKVVRVLKTIDAKKLSASVLLEDAAVHISAIGNLNFLASKVNRNKETAVRRSLENQEPTNDVAVGNYLRIVGPGVFPIAEELDNDLNAIINIATTTFARMQDGTKKMELGKALNDYQRGITVRAAWQKVLVDAHAT